MRVNPTVAGRFSRFAARHGTDHVAGALAAALLLSACAAPAAEPEDPAAARTAWVQQCTDDAGWDDPGPPLNVFGNTYYVGTCGIGAMLIVGDDGHILIDSGTDKGAQIVEANVRALGFDPSDIEVLLITHEHSDHAGGIARLQSLTGARFLTSTAASDAMTTGKPSKDDPQLAIDDTFPPARVDGRVLENERVTLGNLSVTPIFTPGHTPGALSWQWQSCEGNACHTIVYADSLSPISADGYRFSDHAEYVADFRRGLERLSQLDCGIMLTPHPSASGMRDRLANGRLADATSCDAYAKQRMQQLDERLAKESDG